MKKRKKKKIKKKLKLIKITPEPVHLNWLNCFHFLILKGGELFILIDYMVFLSPVQDVIIIF